MADGVGAVDETGERRVNLHAREVEKRHVHLQAQHLPHLVFGEVAKLDQRLAERQPHLWLLLEGAGQLRIGDGSGLDQHLAQLGAHLRPVEQQVQLPARDQPAVDQDLPERHVGGRRLLRVERPS